RLLASISPDAIQKLKPLSEARAAFVLLNLRSGILAGEKLDLRLRLVFPDVERATRGEDCALDAKAPLQQSVRDMLQKAAKNPRLDEGAGVSGEVLQWALRFWDQFGLALQGVKITREDNVVDIELRDLAIDLAGLGTAAGELSKLPGGI